MMNNFFFKDCFENLKKTAQKVSQAVTMEIVFFKQNFKLSEILCDKIINKCVSAIKVSIGF